MAAIEVEVDISEFDDEDIKRECEIRGIVPDSDSWNAELMIGSLALQGAPLQAIEELREWAATPIAGVAELERWLRAVAS